MDSRKLFLAGMLTVLGLAVLTGCADKLTRKHFDMILVGHADRFDVEHTIGKPSDELPDLWHYERVDKHLNAMVHFNEAGKVWRKEWHDVLHGDHYDSAEAPEDSSTYEETRVRHIE